jgi:hypothetical protein
MRTVPAVVVWLGLLVLAIANGAVRELWIVPRLGTEPGHVISTAMLSTLIVLLTWLTIGWLRPANATAALQVGLLWLVLTGLFEFGAGHYLFAKSWNDLLADYDLVRGRVWIVVPIITLFAPLLAAKYHYPAGLPTLQGGTLP